MRFTTALLALIPLAFAQTNSTAGPSLQRSYISAAQAQTILASATANATASKVPQNIAIVDPSGILVAFLRMDNAFVGSIDLSQKKARSAVLFSGLFSSADLYSQVQPGAPLYGLEQSNGGLVVFGGGIPIFVGGQLIGGVGVSGGSVDQDVQVARAGVLGLGASYVAPS
ncbi:DUF336-domain-containing protein [Ophiobolus disseminans]|uniref:DUF336-domain-containing protein n=1 Tax=Ophiobolus disseminans TaxID=1469910 RepID=A0A6A7ABC1_9PLEO|nr:DUF336-domain-containing protein [Ophiobolus disseminans]